MWRNRNRCVYHFMISLGRGDVKWKVWKGRKINQTKLITENVSEETIVNNDCTLHTCFLGHLPTQVVPHLLNLVLLKSHGFAGYQREAGRQAGSGGAQCRLERTCGSVWPAMHSAHKGDRGTQAGKMRSSSYTLLPGAHKMPFVK